MKEEGSRKDATASGKVTKFDLRSFRDFTSQPRSVCLVALWALFLSCFPAWPRLLRGRDLCTARKDCSRFAHGALPLLAGVFSSPERVPTELSRCASSAAYCPLLNFICTE